MIEKETEQEVIEKYACPTCGGEGKHAIHPWDDWESFELCHDCGGRGYFLLYENKLIPDYIPGLEVREFM